MNRFTRAAHASLFYPGALASAPTKLRVLGSDQTRIAMASATLSLPLTSSSVSQDRIQRWRKPCFHLRRGSPSLGLQSRSEVRGRRCGSSLPHLPKVLHVRASTTAAKEEEEFSVLTSVRTPHNDIVVVDTPKSRFLLLDSSHNIHSVYNKERKWTGAYWDEFASLPAIIPQGSIAILGLGGGTAAHLMLDLWPSLNLEGWEIDEILLEKAREYLGLSELEEVNEAGGVLNVHAGDAFSPSATVPGGFAGIVVDLFLDGKVLSELQEVTTWLELDRKLMPNGRIMVNCGGSHSETSNTDDGAWVQNSTIKTLCKAFPGNLSWKRMAEGEGGNFLALTGPEPDLDAWSSAVPGLLRSSVRHWKPCKLA